jgi:hypothetical protein
MWTRFSGDHSMLGGKRLSFLRVAFQFSSVPSLFLGIRIGMPAGFNRICAKWTAHSFRESVPAIDRMIMEETRWGVVSPGSGWSISTFRADFVHFTSKSGLAHFRWKS